MKITINNYKEWVDQGQAEYFLALLDDLNAINERIIKFGKELELHIQTYHNEYSPERTDPCPDYYGMFTFRFSDKPNDTIGPIMRDLEDVDNYMFILYEFVEELFN